MKQGGRGGGGGCNFESVFEKRSEETRSWCDITSRAKSRPTNPADILRGTFFEKVPLKLPQKTLNTVSL